MKQPNKAQPPGQSRLPVKLARMASPVTCVANTREHRARQIVRFQLTSDHCNVSKPVTDGDWRELAPVLCRLRGCTKRTSGAVNHTRHLIGAFNEKGQLIVNEPLLSTRCKRFRRRVCQIRLSSTLYVFGQVQVQNRLLVAMWLSALSRGRTQPPISSMSSHFRRCDQ